MNNQTKLVRGQILGIDRPIQFRVNTKPPITTNKRIQLEGAAISIQNVGDEVVTINNHWTLPVNGVLEFGTNDDYNYFIVEMSISFSGAGSNPRVEVMEVHANIEGYGNLISQ